MEVTLRSAAETVTPGSPKYFDTLYFAGADEGMPFRLVEAEVRPVFLPHPVLGDTLSFAEAGAHDMNRMQVVNAAGDVRSLFLHRRAGADGLCRAAGTLLPQRHGGGLE